MKYDYMEIQLMVCICSAMSLMLKPQQVPIHDLARQLKYG
jgi:hypothetical protein